MSDDFNESASNVQPELQASAPSGELGGDSGRVQPIRPAVAEADPLSTVHRRELEINSAIDPAVIHERGYRTLTRRNAEELRAFEIRTPRDSFPGLLLPMFRATGELIGAQFKPSAPLVVNGRARKYVSPHGRTNVLDVHPRNRVAITDVAEPLWITEGLKKGDALTSRGCVVVTLTGVFNWRHKLATLGDWEDIPLKGREIILCFDADAHRNVHVARAMVRLGRWCRSKRARLVRFLITPSEWAGISTKGCDDFFAAGGTLDALLAAATTTEPETEAADDTFSDARLAETLATDVLVDRFLWCATLGWLRWTGQIWTGASPEAVTEAARQYVLREFADAVERGRAGAAKGWHRMLKAGRLAAVLGLAKGIVEREAHHFDTDRDLLNTPAGVVDLTTGRLMPSDPDLLMTKITRGAYRPGFTHQDWVQALAGVPDDVQPWFQRRVGQAITGHPTPDGLIVIAQGTGENGKTLVLSDGLLRAFGDYAAPASPKLLAKDTHSTERADLRGQRLLVAEELTEDRALNVTAIKQIADVPVIKARHICRDNMTFDATHSLIITTNYVPVVAETDHGTWRRLVRLVFPFTFRKPGDRHDGAFDRLGDPGLKSRLRRGTSGQHDAAVTWAVAGAVAWFAEGFLQLPARIVADTRAWRRQADRILGFWDELLIADDESCIPATALLTAFNDWLVAAGHREWPKELFHQRFRAHSETARHHVEERRPKALKWRISLPTSQASPVTAQRPDVYVGVRFRSNADVVDEVEVTDAATDGGTGRTDLPQPSSQEPKPANVPDGSVPSVPECCEGGPIELRCKLCSASPIYWLKAI